MEGDEFALHALAIWDGAHRVERATSSYAVGRISVARENIYAQVAACAAVRAAQQGEDAQRLVDAYVRRSGMLSSVSSLPPRRMR